ncbi:AraC family transcriptional regulator [Paeniglutamicibacter cryotolerans]|uniref:AraC-like DNA-binding protein n=1 Tax=Paeniglutamicibacter cryotolerans TaxID=670079 RepID=A0A839QK48_9MICC|nr:AraC family transcriptional regulator [Paeniglutamicibacter cryotolerans]MBB2996217.1 AraC-like DNA-binding protein [Paeniglutamicibacter cryotolerans]
MLTLQPAVPQAHQVLDGLPTLRTPDPLEAQERISRLFCEHTLRPLSMRGTVKLNLRSSGGGFGVHLLDYGTTVRIDPGPLGSFYMVQLPLSGRAQLRCSAATIESTPTVASIPPIDQDFSMTWQQGTPQLIVTAPREMLATAAKSLYGARLDGPLRMAHSMNVDTPQGRSFVRAVFEYHDLINDPLSAPAPYTRHLQEETVLARWLLAAKTNADSGPADRDLPAGEARGSSLTAAFTRLLQMHSGEDLGVRDLAEALGVSIRTLQAALAADLGSTPSQLLREERLRRAHALLLAADVRTDSVAAIAQVCGFGHLGRFSQSYRQHFGFPPSQTLRGPKPA